MAAGKVYLNDVELKVLIDLMGDALIGLEDAIAQAEYDCALGVVPRYRVDELVRAKIIRRYMLTKFVWRHTQ